MRILKLFGHTILDESVVSNAVFVILILIMTLSYSWYALNYMRKKSSDLLTQIDNLDEMSSELKSLQGFKDQCYN